MGTAAIAHSAAEVEHPVCQGMMGILEVFIDTILICTLTALVILCSGISVEYGKDTGVAVTLAAFNRVCGNWSEIVITLSLCAFAIATILGWGLYGIRCAQYLFGDGVWRKFVIMQILIVVISATMNTGTVWILSEIVNGLMAIPNLMVLIFLAPKIKILIRDYKNKHGK
jgi:AGCS family alanine or glycine:cation symporter